MDGGETFISDSLEAYRYAPLATFETANTTPSENGGDERGGQRQNALRASHEVGRNGLGTHRPLGEASVHKKGCL